MKNGDNVLKNVNSSNTLLGFFSAMRCRLFGLLSYFFKKSLGLSFVKNIFFNKFERGFIENSFLTPKLKFNRYIT